MPELARTVADRRPLFAGLFLAGLAVSAAAMTLAAAASSTTPSAANAPNAAPARFAPDVATTIASGVDLIAGAFVPGSQPDGNSVVFTGPNGLVVVDTGRHPA